MAQQQAAKLSKCFFYALNFVIKLKDILCSFHKKPVKPVCQKNAGCAKYANPLAFKTKG